MRAARRRGRSGALGAIALGGVAGLAVAAGCLTVPNLSTHPECGGPPIDCRTFSEDRCASVPGCGLSPACTISTKESDRLNPSNFCDIDGTCIAPRCSYNSNGLCVPHCDLITDQTACPAYHSTEVQTNGKYLWECVWAQCNGDSRHCFDYSVAECPANLGCSS